jgi:hypothetical protein
MHNHFAAAILMTMISAPQPASDCVPPAVELRQLAIKLRAENSDANDFLRALDSAMGVDTVFATMNPIHRITKADGLSVYLTGPYQSFRNAILDALRSREPMVTIEIPEGVAVTVLPEQISAPDVIKIVVERGGKAIAPLASSLAPTPMTTRRGAKAVLHSGTVLFPCSAFAPGEAVTVTVVPESGRNYQELARLK